MHLICFRLIKPYRASIIIWALRWHGRNALWALKCQCLFPVPCRFSNFDPIFRFRSDFPVSIRVSSFDPIFQFRSDFQNQFGGNPNSVWGELKNGVWGTQQHVRLLFPNTLLFQYRTGKRPLVFLLFYSCKFNHFPGMRSIAFQPLCKSAGFRRWVHSWLSLLLR